MQFEADVQYQHNNIFIDLGTSPGFESDLWPFVVCHPLSLSSYFLSYKAMKAKKMNTNFGQILTSKLILCAL